MNVVRDLQCICDPVSGLGMREFAEYKSAAFHFDTARTDHYDFAKGGILMSIFAVGRSE